MMSTSPPLTRTNQSGFSMVELMVAMVLGLLLSTAILQIFLGAKATYEFQQELSRVQENGRFAMEFLSRDIRGTDYWGCLNDGAKVTSILNGAGGPNDFAAGLQGLDNVSPASTGYTSYFGGVGQGDFTHPAQPDAIVLQGGQSVGIAVEKVPSKVAPNILLETTVGQIGKGDILLVTDCTNGVIFQVSDDVNPSDKVLLHKQGTSTPEPGNSQNGLGLVFKDDASVYKAGSIRYWIRTGAGGEPALVRGASSDLWTGGDELVEGVENMQILYGEDTTGNGSANYFVPAALVDDMAKVVSVRIHLVVRSLRDNMVGDRKQIQYYAGPNTPPDKRIRKMFTSTVVLRNRLD